LNLISTLDKGMKMYFLSFLSFELKFHRLPFNSDVWEPLSLPNLMLGLSFEKMEPLSL
jgi:hypothetical protein